MIQNIDAKIIVLMNNQYYELKPIKFCIVETPEGTKVEITGTVKDEWVGYEVNHTK